MPPDVGVIMPAYNAEKTVRRAVESLTRGSWPCDVVVVDDCSRVPVADVLGPQPANVEVMRLARNVGVVGARNAGLARLLSRAYEFIAVLDADDVSAPDRLAKQVAFLKAHPDIALVATWARYIDENDGTAVFLYRPPCEPAALRDALFLNNCTVHSSWLVRAQALREVGLYDERYPLGEDYELLRRLAARFALANMPEYLIDYTISMSGLSMQKRRAQLFDRLRIQLKYFDPRRCAAWLGIARTLLLFGVPLRVLAAYRAEIGLRLQHS
jgi:glycosyltransferase involved in cell wall biosynthesis